MPISESDRMCYFVVGEMLDFPKTPINDDRNPHVSVLVDWNDKLPGEGGEKTSICGTEMGFQGAGEERARTRAEEENGRKLK